MLKNILIAALMWPLLALAQSYPSPTFNNVTVNGTLTGKINSTGSTITNATITGGTISGLSSPLPVASGGTNSASPSGAALDNITGFASTGFLTRTGAGAYAFQSLTNGIALGSLAQVAANTVLANATGSTANVAAFSMPGCSAATNALTWTTSAGFTCNSAINAATLGGATFAVPGPIGSTTASTGAFTNLSASGAVSGAGFTNVSVGTVDLLRQISAVPYTNAVSVLGYTAATDGAGSIYAYNAADTTDGAYFTGAIASGVLTVSAVTNGTLALYHEISGPGITPNSCYITSLGTGTGGTGTYNLSCGSFSVASETMEADFGGHIIVDRAGRRWLNTQDAARGLALRQFGAVGNGSSDDTWPVQAAFAQAQAGAIKLTDAGGFYKTSTTLNLAGQIVFEGTMPLATENFGSLNVPQSGTWFYFNHTATGLNISANAGESLSNFGTYRPAQVAPTYGSKTGYSPTNTGTDISITNNGPTHLRNLFLLNPYIGIDFLGTGELYLDGLKSEPFVIGLRMDQCYDTPYVSNLHFWPFWTSGSANNAWNYEVSNRHSLVLRRCDNPIISNVFSIFHFAGAELTDSTHGGANKVHLTNSDFDVGMYGILVDPSNGNSDSGMFSNITAQGAANDSNVGVAGTIGINVTAGTNILQFDNVRLTNLGTYGFSNTSTSTGGSYTFGNFKVDQYNEDSVSGVANAIFSSTSQNVFLNGMPEISGNNGVSTTPPVSVPAGSVKTYGGTVNSITPTTGTTYTNTQSRPIYVAGNFTASSSNNVILSVNGTQISVCTANSGIYCNVGAWVPQGGTYSFSFSGTLFGAEWY